MNLDAKHRLRSLITREGNPNREKICLTYSMAVPSTITSSVQGMNTNALVQSWSVTVSIASYPCDLGSFVIKSRAMTLKGVASSLGVIGTSGA